MSFNFIAPLYDSLAALMFGHTLKLAGQWCVERVPPHSRVLVLGGGTGTLLPRLLQTNPQRVLYLEASDTMLHMAQQKIGKSSANERIVFRHGTETDLEQGERYDAILLPFVLDLYPESTLTGRLLPCLLEHLTEPGALLICDFDQPKTTWQRLQLWMMIRFFRVVACIDASRLPNWPQVLQQAGLVETQSATLRRGQIRMGSWQRVIPAPAPGTPPATR
ncbi:class I SAM-dependent methyltransferase [Fibrella sp. HMF5335]|uniref:Class I SAM-dependent methyltransferase n=1 Tax=Fibrella rubiginis TaxID=2817060 RepID=A0A939K526_9BACT|nr:class I SAM-dependent methyltransferase [Fibrella rubiginis]MBO0936010.1 class I SAM-dependent methyltransferase [Fibrella rubiginis]